MCDAEHSQVSWLLKLRDVFPTFEPNDANDIFLAAILQTMWTSHCDNGASTGWCALMYEMLMQNHVVMSIRVAMFNP